MSLALPSEKRPTQRMVARAAGVTNATVSMALRNHPRISSRTRQHVKRIAQKLGYRPDPDLAKMMHHLRLRDKLRAKPLIAALTSVRESEETDYMAALRRGAETAADTFGYDFSVFRIKPDAQRNASLQRTLRAREIEAVLLLPMREPVSLRSFLDWDDFVVTAAADDILEPEFHRVVPDQFGNAKLICEHLVSRGCRRIGLWNGTQADRVTDHRFFAAVAWQNLLSSAANLGSLMRLDELNGGVCSWYTRQRPDAIIAATENDAATITRELEAHLFGDVEVVVADRSGRTLLGGIDQQPEAIGAAAIALLHAQVQCGQTGVPDVPNATMIKGRWVCPERMRRSGKIKAIGS